MPKILNVILMLCVFVHGHCSVWKLDWSCIRFFFFFFTKKLWLLQWKPQAVTKKTSGWTAFKNIWNEIEHSKSRYGKKIKFDHVVSTTASVGELFSTECRTNMTLKSKQFQKTENISHACIHQTILLLGCLFSFLRMEKDRERRYLKYLFALCMTFCFEQTIGGQSESLLIGKLLNSSALFSFSCTSVL